MNEHTFLSVFLVPATPEIQVSECQVCDNTVTVLWTLPEPDTKIDHYVLEHRRTNHEGPPRVREDYPWMVVEGIREMEHILTGRSRKRGRSRRRRRGKRRRRRRRREEEEEGGQNTIITSK